MQRAVNCEFIINIEQILNISGIGELEVLFLTTDNEKFKLIFRPVWDMRCSTENASIYRFYRFRKNLPDGIINNDIFIVENSGYIKYFKYQACGTSDPDALIHYLITDRSDTVLDILVWRNKPMLVPVP